MILFYRSEDTGRPASSFSDELFYTKEEAMFSIGKEKKQKRIKLVPTTPGSDRRWLPNSVVELGDWMFSRIQEEYHHRDTTGQTGGNHIPQPSVSTSSLSAL